MTVIDCGREGEGNNKIVNKQTRTDNISHQLGSSRNCSSADEQYAEKLYIYNLALSSLDVRLIVGDAMRKRGTDREHRRVETKNI